MKKEDFEGLKTLVEDSDGEILWEKLVEEGVLKIEGGKIEGIYWKGDLDLSGTRIKSLWKLKKVSGGLECNGVKTLEDLGELEEVGGHFWLIGTKIKSLGGLKKIEGGLNCEGVKTLENIGELEEVGGHFWLIGTRIKSLGKLKKVKGFLYCEGVETLEDLGELKEVLLDLYLIGTRIKSLGKLKKVGCNLYCERVKTLENIGELGEVGDNLDLRGCNIEIQLEVIKEVENGKLKVGKLRYDKHICKLYEGGNLKYKEFEDMFGYNIMKIEDEVIRRQAVGILEREYKNKKEEIKKKFEKLKKENAGKDLTEEEKREIKDEIKGWDRNLKEIREKIDKFGVKL